MDITELNDKYVNKLLDNVSKENKTTFLLGCFNVDLPQQLNFLVLSPPVGFYPRCYTQLEWLVNHISKEVICRNLTCAMADPLPSFWPCHQFFRHPSSSKPNVYERSWSSFNKEGFILDYFEKGLGSYS